MSGKQQRFLEQLFQVGKEKKKNLHKIRDVDISLEHKELIRIKREGRIYGERLPGVGCTHVHFKGLPEMGAEPVCRM